MGLNIKEVQFETIKGQQQLLDVAIQEAIQQMQRYKVMLKMFWLDNNRMSYEHISVEYEKLEKKFKKIQAEHLRNFDVYYMMKEELEKSEAWKRPWMRKK